MNAKYHAGNMTDNMSHFFNSYTNYVDEESVKEGLLMRGTGSSFPVSTVMNWAGMVKGRTYASIDFSSIEKKSSITFSVNDNRSAKEILDDIKFYLKMPITELSCLLQVSRQAVYKWTTGASEPESENYRKLIKINSLGKYLNDRGVARPLSLVKMKLYGEDSFLDLLMKDKVKEQHLSELMSECHEMDKAHENSAIYTSMTPKSVISSDELLISGVLSDV